jgi:hypothetical protein
MTPNVYSFWVQAWHKVLTNLDVLYSYTDFGEVPMLIVAHDPRQR